MAEEPVALKLAIRMLGMVVILVYRCIAGRDGLIMPLVALSPSHFDVGVAKGRKLTLGVGSRYCGVCVDRRFGIKVSNPNYRV